MDAHLTWGLLSRTRMRIVKSPVLVKNFNRERELLAIYHTCTMTTTSTIPVGGILASAFSEILGAPVVTYDEYQQRKEESPRAQFQSLDIYQIFRLSYDWGTAEEERDLRAEGGKVSGLSHEVENLSLDEMSVCVKTLNGYTHIVRVGERDSVRHLKENIKERLGMPCEEQRLSFSGNVMDDDYKSISDYGVGPDSSVHMMVQSRSGMCPTTFIDNRSFDPAFDYDFTDKDDGGKSFYRGGERYYRPCGWMRRAIKVRGRFVNDEDGRDDKWLGEPGYREISSEGEWPVPYHGTPKENSDSITTSGYLLSKSQRFKYGRGIYSAPSITTAAGYAKSFTFKGCDYQLVFQNRVCPRDLEKVSAQKTRCGEYWVTKNQDNIRPYGICTRKA